MKKEVLKKNLLSDVFVKEQISLRQVLEDSDKALVSS